LPSAEDSGIREGDLIELKKPKNHPETVAVLAFALSENGISEFTDEDIHRAYLRGGVRPPKVIGQAIRDAKNNYDFIEVGPNEDTIALAIMVTGLSDLTSPDLVKMVLRWNCKMLPGSLALRMASHYLQGAAPVEPSVLSP